MKAVGEPNKRKRPWLSIIKNLLKTKYNIITDISYLTDDKSQTQIYKFNKI